MRKIDYHVTCQAMTWKLKPVRAFVTVRTNQGPDRAIEVAERHCLNLYASGYVTEIWVNDVGCVWVNA